LVDGFKGGNGEGGESTGHQLDEGRRRGGDNTSVSGRRRGGSARRHAGRQRLRAAVVAQCWRWETTPARLEMGQSG
jgi:hypothetical protein